MLINYNSNFKVVDASTKVEICSYEIRERVKTITKSLKTAEVRSNDVVYIGTPRSIETLVAIIACLELQLAFTFCETNDNGDMSCQKFRTTLVFDGHNTRRTAENNSKKSASLDPDDRICYVINTSGTSGKNKKQVAVPHFCIRKNVEHFCSLFELTTSDSILFSTSLLFDPSIIELFMAFHIGCKLILTPDNFRSEPHRMQNALEEFRPTFAQVPVFSPFFSNFRKNHRNIQFTATVFEMLPYPDSILSATSSLRIMLMGGSHFPLSFINSIRSPNNSTRVFNVYGVTEVSCWATYFEVEIGCSEVLIGDVIDGSTIEIDSNGQLILGGQRQCYVNGNKFEKHETGDRVKMTENGGLRIIGRMDRMVKHQGTRVCLDQLAEVALQEDPSIQSVHFIHFKHRNLLQFTTGPATSSANFHTKSIQFDGMTLIITVIHIPNMPINSSGKVDETELKRIAEEHFSSMQTGGKPFQKLIETRLKIRLKEVMDNSFVSIGVNSLIAAELSSLFGSEQEFVMRKMLDNRTTIREILNSFDKPEMAIKTKRNMTKTVYVEMKKQPRMKWAVDLKKCIDGNILVVSNTLAICASHSGIVIAVNPLNGNHIWTTNCGVRFECTPVLVNQEIVIGCKKEGLYFLCLKTGGILSIQRYEDGFGIRSKCAFDGEFIYITTENGHFHAVDPQKHPFFKVSFERKFGPIFSEPLFIDENSVLVTSVHGILTILNCKTGELKDSISLTDENCFCAPLKIEEFLLVTTKSGHVILLNIQPKLQINKVFQFPLPGISFVKSPKILYTHTGINELMFISKNGWILFAKLRIAGNVKEFEESTAFPISNKEVFTSAELEN
ncbi:hypothetical protein CAEBREN_12473 [Caenorhabditis brenneri]|uniref:AMP-dependent synthetase/ligase domain-containing protein n=1 Tax=Caenorhabditis brenneri TaxID=135651 RepID=G0NRH3_CAEBE|nr:hypothetical protein CAEBREN_12473 [Caenorhabditis brenneri]